MAKGVEIRDAALVTLLEREGDRLRSENDYSAAELIYLAVARIRQGVAADDKSAPVGDTVTWTNLATKQTMVLPEVVPPDRANVRMLEMALMAQVKLSDKMPVNPKRLTASPYMDEFGQCKYEVHGVLNLTLMAQAIQSWVHKG